MTQKICQGHCTSFTQRQSSGVGHGRKIWMEIDYKGFGMTFKPLLQGHYTSFNQRYSVYEQDLAIEENIWSTQEFYTYFCNDPEF